MCNFRQSEPLFSLRPAPVEREGVAEYIQRLAKINGYRTAGNVLAVLNTPLHQIVLAGHDKLRAVITGEAPLSSLQLGTCNSLAISPQPARSVVSKMARVCASCIKESDILDPSWSTPLAISCAKHNVRLLDKCPECTRPISRINSQYQCICGFKFQDVTPIASPVWEPLFHEYFRPREVDLQHSCDCHFSCFEVHVARFIRRSIDAQGVGRSSEVAINRCRLFSTDYSEIERLIEGRFRTATAWGSSNSPARTLMKHWRKIATIAAEPKIITAITTERSAAKHRNIQQYRQELRIMQDAEDSTSNLARQLNCHFKTAAALLRTSKWEEYVRTTAKLPSKESLLHCLQKVIGETCSMSEISQSIGLPVEWKGHFGRYSPDSIRLIPNCFRFWRTPISKATKLVKLFERCRKRAIPIVACESGYIRISDISNNAIDLQRWIQEELFDGHLPLAYEQSSRPKKLTDFSISASVLKPYLSLKTSHWMYKLIQFPESPTQSLNPCLS